MRLASIVKRKVDFFAENRYVYGMLDSRTVANRLLNSARDDRRALTPMQLLKLVYLAHGWALGLYGRPLIKDEVQAWRYGPVIPNLYQAVKDYRGGPVLAQIQMPQRENVTAAQASVIEQVYDLYGSMSGPALSRLTHAPGSPWAQVYDPEEFGTVIPDDIIMDHYKRLADAHGGSTPADPA